AAGPDRTLRTGRRKPVAAAVQPAAGRDGALQREGDAGIQPRLAGAVCRLRSEGWSFSQRKRGSPESAGDSSSELVSGADQQGERAAPRPLLLMPQIGE